VRTAGLVHLSGISPALSPDCLALITALLCPAPAAPLYPVSFDVHNWPVFRGLANRADITFAGLDEVHALWGSGGRSICRRSTATSWRSARIPGVTRGG
jgi:2-dehydro-3-deoxygluconokinase